MSAAAASPIPAGVPIAELVRRTAADVARHGVRVWFARRSQVRQLRRLRAALRDAGFQPLYQDNGVTHYLTVEPPGRPPSRAVAWWGPSG
jgi:hypothetical protein